MTPRSEPCDQLSWSTSTAAAHFGVADSQLSELIGRDKIQPPPPIVDGHHRWGAEHILQAQTQLEILANYHPGSRHDANNDSIDQKRNGLA